MKQLLIDIQARSSYDLQKCGVYKYASAPDFDILLFAYSADGGPVRMVDLVAGARPPPGVLSALTDPDVIKFAFGANFERVCLSRYLGMPVGKYIDPASWRCMMVWAATLGLPLSFEGACATLRLEERKEGMYLGRYFSSPARDREGNPYFLRPEDAPEARERLKAAKRGDIELQMAILKRLARVPVPESIWDEYRIDQEINDRGIAVDMELVRQAILMDDRSSKELAARLRRLTGLANPNSARQMKLWLADNGLETDSLDKEHVAALLKTAPAPIAEMLQLWQQSSKSSVKKYRAMGLAVCPDGRVRGSFQFYGASRTGRWASHLIQNLPRNHLPDLAAARALVCYGSFEGVEMLYGDVQDILSQLVRTVFVPRKGKKFVVADYSAIEARVIAWLAGEGWRMDAFAQGRDIYCESAARLFHLPVEEIGRGSHLREKAKVAELGLGFGGSANALKRMGMPEDELGSIVQAWRASNPRIVQLWRDIDQEVKRCIRERRTTETHGIRFACQSGLLFITLPSGRCLAYVRPRLAANRFGGESVTYEGANGKACSSYGSKFVENIVQGIARDILAYAMRTLRRYSIVAHVHDELVIECDRGTSVEVICEQMSRTPPWAKGLLLRVDGYECDDFYCKKND